MSVSTVVILIGILLDRWCLRRLERLLDGIDRFENEFREFWDKRRVDNRR